MERDEWGEAKGYEGDKGGGGGARGGGGHQLG